VTDPHRTAARIAAWADSPDAAGCPDGADALRAVLAGESLDTSPGMAPGWQAVVHQRQRETALQAILAALPPEGSGRRTATAVAGLLRAYVRSGRPHDDQAGVRAAVAAYLAAGGAGSVASLRPAEAERVSGGGTDMDRLPAPAPANRPDG
jgi:hypothetical protein